MIAAATGGRQQRPHYVLGIAVAVLIFAGYLLTQGGLTAPTTAPTPSVVRVVQPSAPPVTLAPPHFDTPPPIPPNEHPTPPVVIGTPPPSSGLLHVRPTPTPRHIFHSGPPLH